MIILEWLFLTLDPCDILPWQLGFQDGATPMVQGIIDLHDDVKSIFLSLILSFFVSTCRTLYRWKFYFIICIIAKWRTNIENLRTIFPCLILLLMQICLNFHEVALCVGQGSSSTPLPDLNLPPEPDSTSEAGAPQPIPLSTEEIELRRQMEEHLCRRLVDRSPPGVDPDRLFQQARETAQLKRQIVDRMPELDTDHADFWRTHRYRIITDALLTTKENDYAPHQLRQMLEELSQPNSNTLRKMNKIRENYETRGTFS